MSTNPAVEPGDDADRHPDGHRDRRGDERDEERCPRSVQHAHEQVAPEAVGAEPECRVRSHRDPVLVLRLREHLVRAMADDVTRDDAREDREQHQDDDDDASDDRSPVLPESASRRSDAGFFPRRTSRQRPPRRRPQLHSKLVEPPRRRRHGTTPCHYPFPLAHKPISPRAGWHLMHICIRTQLPGPARSLSSKRGTSPSHPG